MHWLLLALISVTSISIATILERVLLKEDHSDPIGYALVFQVLLAGIVLMFAFAFGTFTLPTIQNTETVIRYVSSAILWAGATAFGFYALKQLSAAEVTIISSIGTVVSVVLSIVFLHEIVTLPVVIGTLLVLASVVIINSEKLSFESRQGIFFSLAAGACAGIAVVNDAVILQNYEVFSYVAIMSFLPGIVLALIFPQKLKQAKALLFSKTVKLMFVFTFFYAIQAVTYYLAYQSGAPLSHLAPVTKSSIVLTVLLSIVFLRERNNMHRKIIATILVTIGVILLG